MRTVKTLIRLGGCPGWSESSLGAHAILLVLSLGGSYSRTNVDITTYPYQNDQINFVYVKYFPSVRAMAWLGTTWPFHLTFYHLTVRQVSQISGIDCLGNHIYIWPLLTAHWVQHNIRNRSCLSGSLVSVFEPPHDKTYEVTVGLVKTQISLGIRPVGSESWSESSMCAQWVAKDPSFLHADSEDSDQTGRMPRLIWVFAGRTCHFVCFVMRRLIWWVIWLFLNISFMNNSFTCNFPAQPHCLSQWNA